MEEVRMGVVERGWENSEQTSSRVQTICFRIYILGGETQ